MDPTRTFVRSVKRIVIKVGTAVVTRGDGRLAVGRLGALCEQLKELNSQEYEVILVSSGAVGLGRQRLRYRRLANTSFADLQYMDSELDDGKACASVGQGSLMALYDTMFSQLDVTSSQLLVTDGVFRDENFKKTLLETVNSLLALRVIPIFNENDAVSARRREPSADSTGTFWDNDSLAGILARELKADLLVLLSDVDGLYSGPPTDPKSKLIHTYVKEKHQEEITFGDKSAGGRGGMTAKVCAAVSTAFAGVPVVITSGFATDNVINVLQGKRIGTVFHRDASFWPVVKAVCAREMAAAAGKCCVRLQALKPKERSRILLDIADALEAKESLIKAENKADCAAALEDGYDKALVSGLTLDSEKITSLVASIRKLAKMGDPLGHVLGRTVLADGVVTEKVSCPFGVLLVVSESRPDALVQIASLAIRTGNGLLLKGETKMKRSNAILHKIILSALPSFVGDDLIGLVTSKEDCQDLLMLEDVIDLIIPRGNSKLVSLIKESTNIPVLVPNGVTLHVYMDKSSDMDAARNFLLDAKKEYPAADYAKKKLIVHKDLSTDSGFTALIAELLIKGVSVYGGAKASGLLRIPEESPFHLEFNTETWIIKIVEDLSSATDLINRHEGSQFVHVITTDPQTAEAFKNGVDRADVFLNGKSKSSNGTHSDVETEVETASNVTHVRDPLGVEGLLTARWIIRDKKTGMNGQSRKLSL